jgi:hypothetical protein
MIAKAINQITEISKDDQINTDNFLASLKYLEQAFDVITEIDNVLSGLEYDFLPGFVDDTLQEKVNKIPNSSDDMTSFTLVCRGLIDKSTANTVKTEMMKYVKYVDITDGIMVVKING